jgi:hypothetical protein
MGIQQLLCILERALCAYAGEEIFSTSICKDQSLSAPLSKKDAEILFKTIERSADC